MDKKSKILTGQKEHLQNLLESFSEKELYVIISFAEFILNSKSAAKPDFTELLAKSEFENKELNDATFSEIGKARENVRKGKYSSLDEVKREFGL